VIAIIPERVIGMPGTLIGILRNPQGSLREHYAHANLRRLHQTTLLFASLKAELCACRYSDIHHGGDISMAQ
jgi:hypothetical protein